MILRIDRFVLFLMTFIFCTSCAKDLKVSSVQAEQFVKYFGGSDVDKAEMVIEGTDGGFALTGTISVGTDKTKAFYIRTDKFGNEVTSSPVLFGDDLKSTGYSIIKADNGFLVVGSSIVVKNSVQNTDVLVVKIQGDTIAWQRRFGGNSNDEAYSVIQTTSQGYLISGYTESKGKGGKDAWAIMLDSNGNVLWDQTQGGSGNDCYKSVIETNNSYVLVGSTGSWVSSGFDMSVFFVKIAKTTVTGDPFDFTFYGGLSADSEIKTITVGDNNLVVMRTIKNTATGLFNIQLLNVLDDFHQVVWEKNISTENETGSGLFLHNNQIGVVGNTNLSANKRVLVKNVGLDGIVTNSVKEPGVADEIVRDAILSSDGHLVLTGSNAIDNYSKIMLRKMK